MHRKLKWLTCETPKHSRKRAKPDLNSKLALALAKH